MWNAHEGRETELMSFSANADLFVPIGNSQAITGGARITKLAVLFNVSEAAFLVQVIDGNFRPAVAVAQHIPPNGMLLCIFLNE